jgi:hypothetical protein
VRRELVVTMNTLTNTTGMEQLLTARDAAQLLNISVKTLYKLPIALSRVGGRRRYSRQAIATYLAERTTKPKERARVSVAWPATPAEMAQQLPPLSHAA